MSNKKQSSIDWLKKELETYGTCASLLIEWETFDELFEQAKAMHKVEIVNAVDGFPIYARHMNGEEFYNEIFE